MWPILDNNENETFKISSSLTNIFDCNHEEADTRMIDFPCITAEDKCMTLFKRYGCCCFGGLCLCS